MKKNKVIGLILFVIYLLFLAVFLILALQPANESTETSSFLTDIIIKILQFIFNNKLHIDYELTNSIIRKLFGHFSYCLVMGIILYCWLICLIKEQRHIGNISLIISIIIGLLVSLTSELLQLIPEGRGCSIVDVVIDFSGHLLGIVLVFLIYLWKIRKKEKLS